MDVSRGTRRSMEGGGSMDWSGGENKVKLRLATRWIWEDPEGKGEWVAAA